MSEAQRSEQERAMSKEGIDSSKKELKENEFKDIDEIEKENNIKFMEDYDLSTEDFFGEGFVSHELDVLGIKTVIRTLLSKEEKEILDALSKLEGNRLQMEEKRADEILMRSLMSFGKSEFRSQEEALAFLDGQSVALRSLFLLEYNNLCKALGIFLKGPEATNPLIPLLIGAERS